MSAGRQQVWWDVVRYETCGEHDLMLAGLAARLDEAREHVRAVADEAKGAVRAAAASGMSERAIARALGVHRQTVKAWKA